VYLFHVPSRKSDREAGLASQLLLVVLGACLGVLALLVFQRREPTDAPHSGPSERVDSEPGAPIQVAKRLLGQTVASKVVYLNREGARLRGGPDDAAFNISSVVAESPDNRATLPPFASTPTRFSAIAKCVRQKFASFDLEIVEQRPVEGDYVMAMFGGRPADLGLLAEDGHAHSHATGLAPFNGEAIPNAVIFVFTRALREQTVASCEVAGMEIAHAYGLDHARHCRDLMTYMKRCGARSFLDRDLACGEHQDRPCAGGALTQNSYRTLLRALGPAVAAKQP